MLGIRYLRVFDYVSVSWCATFLFSFFLWAWEETPTFSHIGPQKLRSPGPRNFFGQSPPINRLHYPYFPLHYSKCVFVCRWSSLGGAQQRRAKTLCPRACHQLTNSQCNGSSKVTPYRSLYSVLTVIVTVGVTGPPLIALLGPNGHCNGQSKVTDSRYFTRHLTLVYAGLCWSNSFTVNVTLVTGIQVLVRSHFKSTVPVAV